MSSKSIGDAIYEAVLREQYDCSQKLRVRQETHRLYSERPDDFLDWVLSHAQLRTGQLVVDVGCGYGAYHPTLAVRGVRVIALDSSLGMAKEARQQAISLNLPVMTIQGDAQAVPLPDASCERVMANHMLYHVPDQVAALRELRRVLKPNGRVVLVTNAADHNQILHEMHVEAARTLGFTPIVTWGERFNLDHLKLVRSVFPEARRYVRRDAFLFPTAEGALRYYATSAVDGILERKDDDSHRAPLLSLVAERIEEVVARRGVFRVSKDAGCFVANV